MLFHCRSFSQQPLPALKFMPSDYIPSYPSLLLSSLLVTAHSSSFLEDFSSWFTTDCSFQNYCWFFGSFNINKADASDHYVLSFQFTPFTTPVLAVLSPHWVYNPLILPLFHCPSSTFWLQLPLTQLIVHGPPCLHAQLSCSLLPMSYSQDRRPTLVKVSSLPTPYPPNTQLY